MKYGIYRHLLALALFAGVGITVFAQSNQRIDELVSQDHAQAGHVSYLLLSAAGIVSDEVSPQDALRSVTEAGWLSAGTGVSDAVTFGQFSHIMMESFGISGGVMYRIISGPRYAAREVVYQGWSRQRRAPGDSISGDAAVRILSVYLNEQGGVQ
jgi:hypothetical protein